MSSSKQLVVERQERAMSSDADEKEPCEADGGARRTPNGQEGSVLTATDPVGVLFPSLNTPLPDLMPLTIAGFLLGQRRSILTVAACPKAIYVGALLVLTAGLAREYDGEYLWAEPWHLIIPHVASFVTATTLYLIVCLFAFRDDASDDSFRCGYGRFLGLYWMTAPLAWIYAIPFERWLSPVEALRCNIYLLGIVAAWRVILMIRILRVACGFPSTAVATIVVLTFADGVMQFALGLVPIPMLQMMGGVRLTESESLLAGTVMFLRLGGILAMVPLGIASLIALCCKGTWQLQPRLPETKFGANAWKFALLVMIVWVPVLTITQPEQQRRYEVERRLKNGQLPEALMVMSQHNQNDFPPHWDPPPFVSRPQPHPDLYAIIEILIDDGSATISPWVREVFMEKLRRRLPFVFNRYGEAPDEGELQATVSILERLPVTDWLDGDSEWDVQGIREGMGQLAVGDRNPNESEYSDELRSRLQSLVERLNDSLEQQSMH